MLLLSIPSYESDDDAGNRDGVREIEDIGEIADLL